MPVTQEDVVRAAVEALDEAGIAALTLRGVAARLGITAPTLYWHVRSKRHLLDLVAEQVLADAGEVPAAPGEGQALVDWLGDRAREQRHVLLAHRDSALVVAGNRPTRAALPRIERTLSALVEAGLQPGEAVRVLTAVGSFVLGDVLEQQSEAARPLEQEPAGPGPADGSEPAGAGPADGSERAPDFPVATAASRDAGGPDERFEEGLGLLLLGLGVRLAQRQAARTAAGPGPAPQG